MTIVVKVYIDGREPTTHSRINDALGRLNEASFAGVDGVAVLAVGSTDNIAENRIDDFVGEVY